MGNDHNSTASVGGANRNHVSPLFRPQSHLQLSSAPIYGLQAPCKRKRQKPLMLTNNDTPQYHGLKHPTWLIFQDSLKTDFAQFEGMADDSDEMEEESDWEELENEGVARCLAAMVLDDDPKDRDWVPEWLLRKQARQKNKRTCKYSGFYNVVLSSPVISTSNDICERT